MLMLIAAAAAAADLLWPSGAGLMVEAPPQQLLCTRKLWQLIQQPTIAACSGQTLHSCTFTPHRQDRFGKWRQSAAPCPLRIFLKMQILCDKRKRTPRAAAFSSMTDRLIVAQNEFCRMNRALPLPLDSRFSW